VVVAVVVVDVVVVVVLVSQRQNMWHIIVCAFTCIYELLNW